MIRVTASSAPLRSASSKQMPRSLRIHSTAKPKSKLPRTIVFERFSICHDCAAPFEMTSTTASGSRPARIAKSSPSARPCTVPAMQIWFTIFVNCPAPAPPRRMHAREYAATTPRMNAKCASSSEPHMTVSAPFSAPA